MLFDMLETMPYTTNCYLIGDETAKVCALVDPGGSLEKILEMVQSRGLTLEKILLTHGHYDHVGEVEALLEVYPNAAVYLHRLDHREDDKRLYPPPTWGFNHFEDGSHLSVGSIDVQVLHTPGHSPGHMCFFERETGYLFTGDLVYKDVLFAYYPSTDPEAYLASMERAAALPVRRVFPGHHSLDIQPEMLDRVRDAFRELKAAGKLRHGGGKFDYGDFGIWV